jgi:hypothetical protein
MSVWSGRHPVLALLAVRDIPAIPAANHALRGRLRARSVVYDVAIHPGELGPVLAFEQAHAEARSDRQPYEYSQAFALGADEAIHETADLLDADTAQHLAAIRAAAHVVVVEPDSAAQPVADAVAAFERFVPLDVFGRRTLARAKTFTDELLDRDA